MLGNVVDRSKYLTVVPTAQLAEAAFLGLLAEVLFPGVLLPEFYGISGHSLWYRSHTSIYV